MKIRRLVVGMALSMSVVQGAWADPNAFIDRATVISTTPVYHQVDQPQRVCWDDSQDNTAASGDHNYGGAILGALAGGLLGNTVGQGKGRTAAAAVGAVTGALVGDNMDNPAQAQQSGQHCEMRNNVQQVLSGYSVNYQYAGRTMSTMMQQQPGRYIDVRVNVLPAQVQQSQSWQQQQPSPPPPNDYPRSGD